MPKRWLVLSFDGLATASLSTYGSSWNRTNAFDRMAANGLVWDRAIVAHDDTQRLLESIWTASHPDAGETWLAKWRQRGRVELVMPSGPLASRLSQLASSLSFDQCTLVDAIAETSPAASHVSEQAEESSSEEIAETSLARLLMPLLERIEAVGTIPRDVDSIEPVAAPEFSKVSASGDSAQDWSLLWVHSDLLTRCWDAPRWLFPVEEEMEAGELMEDPTEWDLDDFGGDASTDDMSSEPSAPPPLFDSTEVPSLRLSEDSHPDLITSWMQTYGCQIRLMDHLLDLLLQTIEAQGSDIGVIIVGTSGFSLGQNGWIGHRAGPLRSPQIHVPLVIYDGTASGLRIIETNDCAEVVRQCLLRTSDAGDQATSSVRPQPEAWAMASDQSAAAILTTSSRASLAMTNDQWFCVVEHETTRLFSKPDDRDDVNDVANRCRDVVEQMTGEI